MLRLWHVILCAWHLARSQLAPEVPVPVYMDEAQGTWVVARPRVRSKVLAAASSPSSLVDSPSQLNGSGTEDQKQTIEAKPLESPEAKTDQNPDASGNQSTTSLPQPVKDDDEAPPRNTIIFHEYPSVEDCNVRNGGRLVEVPLGQCMFLTDLESRLGNATRDWKSIKEGVKDEEDLWRIHPLLDQAALETTFGKRPYDLGQELVREGLNNITATHILLEASGDKGTAKFCDTEACSRCLEWPMKKAGHCGVSIHGYVSAFWHYPNQEPPNPLSSKLKNLLKGETAGASRRSVPRLGAPWFVTLVLLSRGLLSAAPLVCGAVS